MFSISIIWSGPDQALPAFSLVCPVRSFLIAFFGAFCQCVFRFRSRRDLSGRVAGCPAGRSGSGRGVFCGVKVGRLVGGGVWGRGGWWVVF